MNPLVLSPALAWNNELAGVTQKAEQSIALAPPKYATRAMLARV